MGWECYSGLVKEIIKAQHESDEKLRVREGAVAAKSRGGGIERLEDATLLTWRWRKRLSQSMQKIQETA